MPCWWGGGMLEEMQLGTCLTKVSNTDIFVDLGLLVLQSHAEEHHSASKNKRKASLVLVMTFQENIKQKLHPWIVLNCFPVVTHTYLFS